MDVLNFDILILTCLRYRCVYQLAIFTVSLWVQVQLSRSRADWFHSPIVVGQSSATGFRGIIDERRLDPDMLAWLREHQGISSATADLEEAIQRGILAYGESKM